METDLTRSMTQEEAPFAQSLAEITTFGKIEPDERTKPFAWEAAPIVPYVESLKQEAREGSVPSPPEVMAVDEADADFASASLLNSSTDTRVVCEFLDEVDDSVRVESILKDRSLRA